MRILFVGDVFGVPGRRALEDRLPGLRDELDVDFCIVNGENAADGAGITGKHADRMLAAGADVITLGNHTWRQRGIADYLAGSDRVLRPAHIRRSRARRGGGGEKKRGGDTARRLLGGLRGRSADAHRHEDLVLAALDQQRHRLAGLGDHRAHLLDGGDRREDFDLGRDRHQLLTFG